MENAHIQQVTTSQWLSLKASTKEKLRETFSIPRSSCVEVITDMSGIGKIMSDGTTHKDLSVITIDKMRDYVGQEITTLGETFNTLFEKVIAKIEGDEPKPIVEYSAEIAMETALAPEIQVIKEEEKVVELRTVECPVCKKVINCKDAKFDVRVIKMHVNKYHKENKI